MSDDKLLRALKQTRDDYDQQLTWQRYQMDAYTGGGGFQGRIKQPSTSYFGGAAVIYGTGTDSAVRSSVAHPLTYLDQFDSEEAPKFRSRIDCAHYPNYVAPLTDLKLGYIAKKPHTVENRPAEVEAWHTDELHPFAPHRRLLMARAAVFGWCPQLIDMPAVEQGVSRAQAKELGHRPVSIPLYPANLLDYDVGDGGELTLGKIKTCTVERGSWMEKPTPVETYTIWTRETFSRYVVRKVDGREVVESEEVDVPHDFGRVPIVIWRWMPSPDDPVQGLAAHDSVALEARALFNRISEFEEHLRSQVFALFVYVTDDPESGGELKLGVDNAIPLRTDAGHAHHYIAPPATPAETYEKRIEATIREMYRMARVEFTRPTGSATSGISRRFEFAQTNQALCDAAASYAKAEREMDILVGIAYGIDPATTAKESITAADDFDVDDLQADIKAAFDAHQLDLGPTNNMKLRERIAQQMLPNRTKTEVRQADEELEAMADAERVNLMQAADPFADDEPDAGPNPDDIADPMADPSDEARP